MKKLQILLAAGSILLTFGVMSSQAINIIPQPAEVKSGVGAFTLTNSTVIAAGSNIVEARQLQQAICEASGLNLRQEASPQSNAIRLIRDEKLRKELGEEGYLLDVKPGSISITAPASTGSIHRKKSRTLLLTPPRDILILYPR